MLLIFDNFDQEPCQDLPYFERIGVVQVDCTINMHLTYDSNFFTVNVVLKSYPLFHNSLMDAKWPKFGHGAFGQKKKNFLLFYI